MLKERVRRTGICRSQESTRLYLCNDLSIHSTGKYLAANTKRREKEKRNKDIFRRDSHSWVRKREEEGGKRKSKLGHMSTIIGHVRVTQRGDKRLT